MIHDVQELGASLRYMTRWAETLEDLRRYAQETDGTLLPVTSSGPLSEIRRVLAEAREFVEGLDCEESLGRHLAIVSGQERAA